MSSLDDVARELGLLFRSLKGMHHDTAAIAGIRVELPALGVLGTLESGGRLRPSTLADRLQLDLSSVSRQVAGLEREGWVSRTRDPLDSRAALLELTPAGRDVLARIRAARVQQLARSLPSWSEPELSDLAATLHRFRVDLESPHSATTQTATTQTAATQTATPHTTTIQRVPALSGQESP